MITRVREILSPALLHLVAFTTCLVAPGDLPAQTSSATVLYIYDEPDGEPIVTTTPLPGRTPTSVETPTGRRTQAPSPIPVAAASPLVPMIVGVAKAHGLEPAMVLGLIETESFFDAAARSPMGALGLMQLMPVLYEPAGIDPTDPVANVETGCTELVRLLARYDGDWHQVLAAYNTGSGRVRRAGGPPTYTLPYVKRVMRARARWAAWLGTHERVTRPTHPHIHTPRTTDEARR